MPGIDTAALFRYDLDRVADAESTLVLIGAGPWQGLSSKLEVAADGLAEVLLGHQRPKSRYRLSDEGRLV